jgi:hypothetical protein
MPHRPATPLAIYRLFSRASATQARSFQGLIHFPELRQLIEPM